MMLVGIRGKAGAGKDEVAKVFVEHYHCRRYAFATRMKEAALALDPIIEAVRRRDGSMRYVRLSELIAHVGAEQAKKHPEVRRTYQRIGTEMGRESLDPDLWIKLLFKRTRSKRAVISDVRFANEVEAIRKRNGFIILVQRPGHGGLVGTAAEHASEQLPEDGMYDAVIVNDGALEDLPKKVAYALASLGKA